MKFSESLKKNRDFKMVYNQGRSYANRYLVMYVMENYTDRNRIGISVSKKVGNSVIRHHLTRLIRESYRLHEDMFNSGLDMVCSPGGTTIEAVRVLEEKGMRSAVIEAMKACVKKGREM